MGDNGGQNTFISGLTGPAAAGNYTVPMGIVYEQDNPAIDNSTDVHYYPMCAPAA